MTIQGVIFLISTIVLELSFILVKKVDKKINILSFIGITIVVNMCYNAFLCYVLSFFGVPNKLYLLSSINIIFSIILFILTFKKQKDNKFNIQKYTISKIDVFCSIVILVVTLGVTYLNFGFPFNIKYESGDPSTHYLTSIKFMQDEKLLSTSTDYAFKSFKTRKFVSYVNSGLIMKCFEGKINIIDNYIIFIAFGIFILFLTGYLLYFILIRFSKNEKTKLVALLVSVLCMLGYPLNSLLFGFEYMSLSFTVILAIIEIAYMYTKENGKLSYIMLTLFLLNFGLFCSYFMFVPFVYSAEWIYFWIYGYKKEGKLFTKKTICFLVVTLLLPFFLGYIYHLAPNIYQIIINNLALSNIQDGNALDASKSIIDGGFNTKGYVYTNLYSNFILLLPLSLYVVVKKFKENKLLSLLFILNVGYIILLLIGRAFDKVSYYYLSKNYFTLWIIMFILNYRALMYLYDKNKYITYLVPISYTILAFIYIISIPTTMKNEEITTRENVFRIMDIYGANTDMLINKDIDLYKDEIDLIKYVKNEMNLESDYLLVGDPQQIYWLYSFTQEIKENEVTINHGGQSKFNYVFLEYENLINNSKYIIYFNGTIGYEHYKEQIFKDGTIIYSNEIGGVVEKK